MVDLSQEVRKKVVIGFCFNDLMWRISYEPNALLVTVRGKLPLVLMVPSQHPL